jgi:bifunctional pyridoxal-dependent enzyme with beta-cystathionase and maltose regulon repressor activities
MQRASATGPILAELAREDVTLTLQELQAAHHARYDLGPGYPQLPVPDYIQRLYRDDTIEALSLLFAPQWSPVEQEHVDADLEQAVRRFLEIPGSVETPVRATFSGSVALDRVVAGIARYGSSASTRRNVDFITTTPCIDVVPLFLSERGNVRANFVASRRDGLTGALDVRAVNAAIEFCAKKRDSRLAVVLSSPENPTGAVWSEEDLASIANTCKDGNAILVVDHCFAVAGVHSPTELPRIWNLEGDDLDWIAVWDTGKTFGLNEDKLGFVVASNHEMLDLVDSAITVTQFGVARRQKLFFGELLSRAVYFRHTEALRETCRANLALALERAPSMVTSPPAAGSLLMLDLTTLGLTDQDARRQLLRAGVGVIAGSAFFHTEWRPTNFIRVALAREPSYFEAGFDHLLTTLKAAA